MAKQEASIVFKAYDEISGAMRSMENQSEKLDKEWELQQRQLKQLGERYKKFNAEAAETKAKVIETKKAMDEARKSFKASGDEADKTSFINLQKEYQSLTDKAKAYQEAAASTRKAMRETADTARRTSGPGLFTQLGQAGAFKMVGDVAGQWAGTMAGSILGDAGGSLFGSALSGIGSGAAIGSMIAPGIGTAIGGLTGGALNLLGGAAQIYEQKDDAFKDYYGNLYRTANQQTVDSIEQGKGLAARREADRLAFTTALGGEAEADQFLGQLLSTANSTPFLYDDLTSISQTLLSFGKAADEVIPTLLKVGDAGAAKGLGAAEISEVARYLGQMHSFDKASREFLEPLVSRGFAVYDWLAEAKGVSKRDLDDMISKGEVSGTWAEDVILAAFQKNYGGMMDQMSATTEGLDSTLQGLMENIDAAGGDAYNQSRNEQKERTIDSLDGALGKEMEFMSAIAGENQAALENQADQLTQRAIEILSFGTSTASSKFFDEEATATLRGWHEEYRAAKTIYDTSDDEDEVMAASIKIENLEQNAIALATAVHESSDLYKLKMDAEDEQVVAIRNNTAAVEASTIAFNHAQLFTQGQGAMPTSLPTMDQPAEEIGREWGLLGPYMDSSNAFGLRSVPYDGYAAFLHQGERVLTAAEARQADREVGNITVNVTGGTYQVRSEDDIGLIAEELASRLALKLRVRGG